MKPIWPSLLPSRLEARGSKPGDRAIVPQRTRNGLPAGRRRKQAVQDLWSGVTLGDMKLSVIIPAYNEEKLLPGCLASVASALQANAAPDWSAEVIVTDNNSNDRTAQLARDAGA